MNDKEIGAIVVDRRDEVVKSLGDEFLQPSYGANSLRDSVKTLSSSEKKAMEKVCGPSNPWFDGAKRR